LLSAIEDTFKTGNPHKDIEYEMTKDNNRQKFYLSGSTALIKSANPDNLLLLCLYDITARKQAELDISQKNKELQKINATKDKFFSIISHDLKSPFHSIVGFSELLLEQVKEKSLEGTQRYAEIIQKSANRAINLLVNLTEWSLSQSNRKSFNPANFYVDELADEIIMLFSETASQKSINVVKKIPAGFSWKADKDMISTVLRNLVSNALKFSFPDSEVIIETHVLDSELWISVKDSGVGIPPDALEKLFRIDVNYTTHGTQKEVGTGLGLILCKEFIEKHNGEIRVESEEGKGAVFSFSLPMKN
jgi:signal transduction histidine kinase